MSDPSPVALAAVVEGLRDATNAHDLDAITACFGPDYRNETPAHPSRGFVGADQVRQNWTRILAAVPDLSTEITASAVDEAHRRVWSEWEHRGTRRDGLPHLMRGVIVFTIEDQVIESARFYLEPVVDDGVGIDQVVARQMQPQP
jgi:ketosteroid isomerase-like protein